MSIELRGFLELLYSFAKQYISWYERCVKGATRGVTIKDAN